MSAGGSSQLPPGVTPSPPHATRTTSARYLMIDHSMLMSSTALRTARLLLRRFQPGDVDDSLASRDDPEFARYLPHVPQPFTRRDAEEFVRRNIEEPWDRQPTFAVVLDDHVIGTVNLEIDAATHTAMIGYAIARVHWGRGIAIEAAGAVLAWAFAAHDLVEVWASTDVANVRSQRVMEKLGLRRDADRTAKGDVCYRLRR